ncbi:lipase family protein [Sphingomonas xinjiangensis]|uniref:DUF2974 domain-containing protein n=1 Tax=Sphingomonas xinjiangensis TaxID=643568 RepID=A0A840YML4_9SPHN|nr:Mbeg1-like protein [Sphingomonas xinjiangensis]MBB5710890.1 hypothetical protein [Sphingomonas xinjiangensis]
MTATNLVARNHGIVPSSAVVARLREAANDDFQSQHLPALELHAWQQAAAPIRFVRAEAPPAAIERIGAPSTRELALLAADVYNDVPAPPPGYRTASDNDLASIGLRTQDLTSPQSAFRARVYVSEGDGGPHFVVSFRGSTGGSDWRANAQQGVGLSSDHYARALLIAKAVARHPEAQVTITGHSLGGGLASAAALASGRDAQTFNAAGLSNATIRQAEAQRARSDAGPTPRIAAFYVRGEILSAVQDGGDRVAGAIFGGAIGGVLADAPEAYGTRVPLDPMQPVGEKWYQDNPVARHGMDWVLSSLGSY